MCKLSLQYDENGQVVAVAAEVAAAPEGASGQIALAGQRILQQVVADEDTPSPHPQAITGEEGL